MKKVFVLSNNPLVFKKYEEKLQIVKVEGSLRDVLIKARDYVHIGHELVTHPLAGSIKPNETIYKSIVLTEQQATMDFKSLEIIEAAIVTNDKLVRIDRSWNEKVYDDFQFIDASLLESGLDSLPFDCIL